MGRPIPSALDDALDCTGVEPVLAEIVRARFGPETELHSIRAEIVKRRVLRYSLELARPDQALTTWPVIGKVYDSIESGARGFHTHRWLWTQGFGNLNAPSACIPETYAYAADVHTLFMEEVGGKSLKKLLGSGRARVRHMQLFAEALAKLHRFPGNLGQPFTLDDHLARRCAGLTDALAWSFPDLAPEIETIVATARRQPSEPMTLVHGDFHPGQVHIDDQQLWILDLDPLHQGAPAYDVAMVVVILKLLGAAKGEERYFRSLGATFLERYYSRVDPALARALPVQAALILLKRACKRFRWQDEPGWEEAVRRQVRCGAALAALQEQNPPPHELEDVLELYARFPDVA